MPEYPEILATTELLRQGKDFPGSSARYRSLQVSALFFLCRLIDFPFPIVYFSTYPTFFVAWV